MSIQKPIAEFKHKANGRTVTASLYLDGSTVCACRKWIVAEPDGSRICPHTESIKRDHPQARARTEAYRPARQTVNVKAPAGTPITVTATKGTTVSVESTEPIRTGRRKFSLE